MARIPTRMLPGPRGVAPVAVLTAAVVVCGIAVVESRVMFSPYKDIGIHLNWCDDDRG